MADFPPYVKMFTCRVRPKTLPKKLYKHPRAIVRAPSPAQETKSLTYGRLSAIRQNIYLSSSRQTAAMLPSRQAAKATTAPNYGQIARPPSLPSGRQVVATSGWLSSNTNRDKNNTIFKFDGVFFYPIWCLFCPYKVNRIKKNTIRPRIG